MHKVRTMRQLSVTKTKASSSMSISEQQQQQQQSDSTSVAKIRKVAGLEGKRVVQASIGGSHVALLTDDGEVFCYGEGDSGQLGLGATARRVDRPTRVTAALDSVSVVHVACGAHHTAAVTSSGSLVTWYDTRRRHQIKNKIKWHTCFSHIRMRGSVFTARNPYPLYMCTSALSTTIDVCAVL